MIDHAPAFHARQREEEENRIIEELDAYAAPLHWMLLVVLAILLASQAWEGWKQYADYVAANEALVQCMNGRSVGIADVLIRCDVKELVAEVQP